MTKSIFPSTLLTIVLSSPGLRAETPSGEAVITNTATRAVLTDAGCTRDPDAIARSYELFTRAGKAYEAGDLAEALQAIKSAYALSGCDDFLVMIADLNLDLERSCPALEGYQQYLKVAPQGANAENVRARILKLVQACPDRQLQPDSAPALPTSADPLASGASAEPPTNSGVSHGPAPAGRPGNSRLELPSHDAAAGVYWTPSRIAGWSSIGAGAAAAIGATYFAVAAKNSEAAYEAAWKNGRWGELDSLETTGERKARIGRVLGVTAASLASVGALMLLFGADILDQRPPLEVSVDAGSDNVTGTYRLSF